MPASNTSRSPSSYSKLSRSSSHSSAIAQPCGIATPGFQVVRAYLPAARAAGAAFVKRVPAGQLRMFEVVGDRPIAGFAVACQQALMGAGQREITPAAGAGRSLFAELLVGRPEANGYKRQGQRTE